MTIGSGSVVCLLLLQNTRKPVSNLPLSFLLDLLELRVYPLWDLSVCVCRPRLHVPKRFRTRAMLSGRIIRNIGQS